MCPEAKLHHAVKQAGTGVLIMNQILDLKTAYDGDVSLLDEIEDDAALNGGWHEWYEAYVRYSNARARRRRLGGYGRICTLSAECNKTGTSCGS